MYRDIPGGIYGCGFSTINVFLVVISYTAVNRNSISDDYLMFIVICMHVTRTQKYEPRRRFDFQTSFNYVKITNAAG